MIYVEFMKNFPLADSSELIVVSLISSSWAQKRLIPTFWTWCTSSSWKIFFSPIRANFWLLDSFWPPEPKKVWFLPFLTWCTSSSWKILFSLDSSDLMTVKLISASWAQKRLIPTFWTWFTSSSWKITSSRHDSSKLFGCYTHFGLLSPKTFHSHFLDMMYVEFMKNSLLADSSELIAVRLISASC